MRIARLGLALMKGARHRTLAEIEVTSTGPAGDRELCLVDPARRRVMRTVEHPELMQVRASWTGRELVTAFPDRTLRAEPRPTGERLRCDYWGRSADLELLECTQTTALCELVGLPVLLARALHPGAVVFGAALTLITTTDLAELARRVGDAQVARESARFRATATIEDEGRLCGVRTGTRLRLGEATIEITGPIPRCTVIDHDPTTGRRDRTLLKTLATYRHEGGEIRFGHYARVVSPGRCCIGDDVVDV